MSYNIRHGRGLDGRVDLDRIAAVIAEQAPDVVALQEVDLRRARSGGSDQAAVLGVRLGMDPRFAPCMRVGDADYGIATLSRLPVLGDRRVALPHNGGGRFSEPRCALVLRLAWTAGLGEVEVVNTHLSLLPGERGAQVDALGDELGEGAVVVAGDLNCTPRSACYRRLGRRLRAAPTAGSSWPSRMPVLQLDHLLYGGGLEAASAHVVRTRAARRASDHLPVVADFHGSREAP